MWKFCFLCCLDFYITAPNVFNNDHILWYLGNPGWKQVHRLPPLGKLCSRLRGQSGKRGGRSHHHLPASLLLLHHHLQHGRPNLSLCQVRISVHSKKIIYNTVFPISLSVSGTYFCLQKKIIYNTVFPISLCVRYMPLKLTVNLVNSGKQLKQLIFIL